jgi:hypothetical protein
MEVNCKMRSLTYYQFNDDLNFRNYLALVSCILNPKLTHKKAVRLFELDDSGDKRKFSPEKIIYSIK